MSYTTELTDDYAGIIHVGEGNVSGQELIEACRVTTSLVENTENFHYQFIDFSGVDELNITEENFDQIVAQDYFAELFRPNAVVVIVAPREDIFAIAKEWQRRIEDIGWNTYIAHSRAEGRKWLRDNFPQPPPATTPTEASRREDAAST